MQDIHTHLYWKSYDEDRDQVVARAREAGIREMLVVGTTLEESRQALEVAQAYEDMYATVGIHPNEFREAAQYTDNRWIQELERLATDPKVVAIGECGLDYSESHGGIDAETKARQTAGFVAQLELAGKLGLPVIIHCRDAYADMLAILEEKGAALKAVILHCYMGDTEVTQEFLKIPNIFFSFTGNITYPVKKKLAGTKDDLTETVKLIPKERIFIETDCPFLAPQAFRGQRNEPAYAIHTAEKACELLGLTRSALDGETGKNFREVFLRGRQAPEA
ncbi:MAG: hypothetical protein A2808_01725 [Candidatus Moranbacteria bacterium RIFCSPHIGHO2_01_FULL_55_24]|nr:MAG: hypothetical protein A2808_01725 [Candidatus Moranbacteria bacterium RIFCSPHIGHO2_01_FULL_55_24]